MVSWELLHEVWGIENKCREPIMDSKQAERGLSNMTNKAELEVV